MRRATLVLPVLLAGSLACRRPEVEAFRQAPKPVVVSFLVPESVPDAPGVAKEYAAALRHRLATRLEVVPEGVEPPEGAARLQVVITAMRPTEASPTAAEVGVATGVTVGVLSGLAGNRHPVWSGFWWGMFAGHHASHHVRREDRLGFRPTRVDARLQLTQPGLKDPVIDMDLDPGEIFDAIDPIRRSEEEDAAAIREAEGRALARVAVRKLDEQLELRVREPRWYGGKPGAEAEAELEKPTPIQKDPKPLAEPVVKPEPKPAPEGEPAPKKD